MGMVELPGHESSRSGSESSASAVVASGAAAPRRSASPTPDRGRDGAAPTSRAAGLDTALIDRLTKRPRRRRHHFGLFGPMGVGKTTFLAALYLSLDRDGYLNHDLTDADSNAFLDWFVRHLNSGELLPATQQSWEIGLGVTREGRNARVAFRDIPGGWFTEEADWEDRLRDIERQLHQCRGSIFFIDTGLILNAPADSPERRFVNRVVDRAIRRTQRGVGARLTGVRPPVAICFSKADLLTREMAPDVLTAEDEDELLRQKADYLWSKLGRFDNVFREGRYRHAAYFALSALGSRHAPQPDRPLRPHGVQGPFWFLVQATRGVNRARRRRTLAAVAVALVAAVGFLGMLGLNYYQRQARPAYEALVQALNEPRHSLGQRVELAETFLDKWEGRLPHTLYLLRSELAEVRQRRTELNDQWAAQRLRALERHAAEPAERANRTAAQYAALLGDVDAFSERFPNVEPDRVAGWRHTFDAKRRLAEVREKLHAGGHDAQDELDLLRALDSVVEGHPQLAPAAAAAREQWRQLFDEANFAEFRGRFGKATGYRQALEYINQYLATRPGDDYRRLVEEMRAGVLDDVRRAYRAERAEIDAQAEAWDAEQWRSERFVLIETYQAQYEPLAPEIGRYFFEERQAAHREHATRQLDAMYASFEADALPLERRRDMLRDWLRDNLGHPREEEVIGRLDRLREREVQQRYYVLVEEASAVDDRESLLRFLERLRDWRDANPEAAPTPTVDELERRARLNWPRHVLGEAMRRSRDAAVWNDAASCRRLAAEIRDAMHPFETDADAEVQRMVAEARERIHELLVQSKALDWRDVRSSYLGLYSAGLTPAQGRRRLDQTLALCNSFLETHEPSISPVARERVQEVRALLRWVREPRAYRVTIRHANFTGAGSNLSVAFDHSTDGSNWIRRHQTERVGDERPTYNETFTLTWQAFDGCHVKGIWHAWPRRSGVFYSHTQRGLLSLLDIAGERLPNEERGGKPDLWLFLTVEWPAEAPQRVRDLPSELPMPAPHDDER